MDCSLFKYVFLLKLKQKNEQLSILAQKSIWICKLFLLLGWKQGTDDGKEDVTYSNNRTCEEELLTSIFNACDTKCRGQSKIICSNVRWYSSCHCNFLLQEKGKWLMCGALCICVYTRGGYNLIWEEGWPSRCWLISLYLFYIFYQCLE